MPPELVPPELEPVVVGEPAAGVDPPVFDAAGRESGGVGVGLATTVHATLMVLLGPPVEAATAKVWLPGASPETVSLLPVQMTLAPWSRSQCVQTAPGADHLIVALVASVEAGGVEVKARVTGTGRPGQRGLADGELMEPLCVMQGTGSLLCTLHRTGVQQRLRDVCCASVRRYLFRLSVPVRCSSVRRKKSDHSDD